jgi:hypothetical protein
MKKTLIAGLLLASGTMFAGSRFSIGIGFGAPVVAPPVYAAGGGYAQEYIPPCPGPNYSWVAGYYGGGGAWIPGYWNYVAPVVVEPAYGYGYGYGANFGYVGRDFGYRRDFDRGRDSGYRRDFDRGRDSGNRGGFDRGRDSGNRGGFQRNDVRPAPVSTQRGSQNRGAQGGQRGKR